MKSKKNENKPLYFYHVINKDINIEEGLISLQYMYDNKKFKLFDKYSSKYRERIVSKWNINKYVGRNPDSLTREEIIDALNIFRGENGSNYIYFFRYPPYKELGRKMEELLNVKDVYEIDINDEEVKKEILDISFGFNMSNTDNFKLDKVYYENITKEEYFKNYNDAIPMNFSTLNHIGIAFKDGICPIKLLKKIN